MKSKTILLYIVILSTLSRAYPPLKYPQEKTIKQTSHKKLHGYLRIHHIIDGKSNQFDKNTGSTLGFGFKYNQHFIGKLSGGVEYYGVSDTGLTNQNKSIAYGQLMTRGKTPHNLEYGDTWGLHLSYHAKTFKATLARSQFDSPLTNIEITHVPNMYEYTRIDTTLQDTHLSFAYITKMAYGSRAASDFGLIGEKTGTAGIYLNPLGTIKRGKYYTIADTLNNNNIDGITVLGAKKTVGNLKIELCNFYAKNAFNTLYLEAVYPFYTSQDYTTSLHVQYLNQKVDNTYKVLNYGGNFYGIRLRTTMKKLKLNLAYNHKDNRGSVLNPWGANPAFTSSIFSRNAYRSNTSAYKIAAIYPIIKDLKVTASHANYGQSAHIDAKTDAKETNFIVVYKPKQTITMKLFHVKRTSELHTATSNKTQAHTRFILNYNF